MEKMTTSMDQHGRMLVPAEIRHMLNIKPGDKVNLEISDHEVKIIGADQVIDEMYSIFTKNKNIDNSAVDDFINQKREEYNLDENKAKQDKE